MPSRLRVGIFDRAGYVHSIGEKRIRKVFGCPYPVKPRFRGDLEKFFRGWHVVFWRERRRSRGKQLWFKELSKKIRTLEAQREAVRARKLKVPEWEPPEVPPRINLRRRQAPQAQVQQAGFAARAEEQQRLVNAYNNLLMQQAEARAEAGWRAVAALGLNQVPRAVGYGMPAPQEPEPDPIRWFGEEPERNDEE